MTDRLGRERANNGIHYTSQVKKVLLESTIDALTRLSIPCLYHSTLASFLSMVLVAALSSIALLPHYVLRETTCLIDPSSDCVSSLLSLKPERRPWPSHP